MADISKVKVGGVEYDIKDAAAREGLRQLSEDMENLQTSGLTTAQVTALDGLFKVAAYDDSKDVASAYAAFKTAFGLSDSESGGGDSGDDTETTTYTITNNLTNVTTDNSSVSIESGKLYTANLTADDGYSIDSVVITMGGVEISAYGDGVISIDSVTGDVVITATAVQTNTGAAVYELAEATTFDGTSAIDTGVTLALTDESWTICVDWTGIKGYNTVFATHGAVEAQSLRVHSNSGYYVDASVCDGNARAYTLSQGGGKYVITHYKGETKATVYYISGGAVTSETPTSQYWNTANNNPTTLKLGGSFNGTPSFEGTINRFAVYKRMLTADEISEFMGV